VDLNSLSGLTSRWLKAYCVLQFECTGDITPDGDVAAGSRVLAAVGLSSRHRVIRAASGQ
jgi:hypothetical protein